MADWIKAAGEARYLRRTVACLLATATAHVHAYDIINGSAHCPSGAPSVIVGTLLVVGLTNACTLTHWLGIEPQVVTAVAVLLDVVAIPYACTIMYLSKAPSWFGARATEDCDVLSHPPSILFWLTGEFYVLLSVLHLFATAVHRSTTLAVAAGVYPFAVALLLA